MNSGQIEQIFSVARGREIEAHEFYASAAARVKNSYVKEIFEQLANDEMGHYELLEKFRRDPSLPMKMTPPSSDWKVAESEELPKLSIEMKPRDAVALAMKKEQQAVAFYRSMSSATGDAATKAIFENLANMELGHKRRLETMFVDIGYPEEF